MKIANKLVSITRKRYGNSAECFKLIVERVAKPADVSKIYGKISERRDAEASFNGSN